MYPVASIMYMVLSRLPLRYAFSVLVTSDHSEKEFHRLLRWLLNKNTAAALTT